MLVSIVSGFSADVIREAGRESFENLSLGYSFGIFRLRDKNSLNTRFNSFERHRSIPTAFLKPFDSIVVGIERCLYLSHEYLFMEMNDLARS